MKSDIAGNINVKILECAYKCITPPCFWSLLITYEMTGISDEKNWDTYEGHNRSQGFIFATNQDGTWRSSKARSLELQMYIPYCKLTALQKSGSIDRNPIELLHVNEPAIAKPPGRPPGATNKNKRTPQQAFEDSTQREPSRFEYVQAERQRQVAITASQIAEEEEIARLDALYADRDAAAALQSDEAGREAHAGATSRVGRPLQQPVRRRGGRGGVATPRAGRATRGGATPRAGRTGRGGRGGKGRGPTIPAEAYMQGNEAMFNVLEL